MSSQLLLQPDGASGADSYLVNADYAGINIGDATVLNIGTTRVAKVTLYSRAILRFDLSPLPPGATILDARLTLFSTGSGAVLGSSQFKAYRLTRGDWTELGATWNQYDGSHAWTTAGGDYAAADADAVTISSAASDLVFTSLENLVIDAQDLRSGMLNLLIVGPETGSTNNYVSVYSSDDPSHPTLRPRLVIDYEVPTLSLADHEDGTGATASISGTDPSGSNTLFVEPFQGDLAAGAWISAGQRTGNGTIELNLATGHYFAHVATAVGHRRTLTNVVYFPVSDGLESIHTRCLAAVQAKIRLLSMSGLSSDRVVIEKLPVARPLVGPGGLGLPAVIVSPQRAAMPATGGTNRLDDVHYDVLVTILDRDNQEPTLAAQLDRHLLWRQQIARAFRNQRLPGVSEVIDAAVEPADGLLEEAWKRELAASALLLRFTSREVRGF